MDAAGAVPGILPSGATHATAAVGAETAPRLRHDSRDLGFRWVWRVVRDAGVRDSSVRSRVLCGKPRVARRRVAFELSIVPKYRTLETRPTHESGTKRKSLYRLLGGQAADRRRTSGSKTDGAANSTDPFLESPPELLGFLGRLAGRFQNTIDRVKESDRIRTLS